MISFLKIYRIYGSSPMPYPVFPQNSWMRGNRRLRHQQKQMLPEIREPTEDQNSSTLNAELTQSSDSLPEGTIDLEFRLMIKTKVYLLSFSFQCFRTTTNFTSSFSIIRILSSIDRKQNIF